MRRLKRIFKFSFFIFLTAFGFFSNASPIDSNYRISSPVIDSIPIRHDYSKTDFCDCNYERSAPIIHQREINTELIERRSKERDFQYERTVKDEASSFWDNFLNWLQRKLFGNITRENAIRTRNIIYWIIGVFAVLIVAYWLYKSEFLGSPLRRGSKIANNLYDETERSEEDIESRIIDALKNEDFPLAIRWVYIKAIKVLALKNEIDIRQDKTNYDYYLELKSKELREPFNKLTRIFEYTNYGNFESTINHYHEANSIFTFINSTIFSTK